MFGVGWIDRRVGHIESCGGQACGCCTHPGSSPGDRCLFSLDRLRLGAQVRELRLPAHGQVVALHPLKAQIEVLAHHSPAANCSTRDVASDSHPSPGKGRLVSWEFTPVMRSIRGHEIPLRRSPLNTTKPTSDTALQVTARPFFLSRQSMYSAGRNATASSAWAIPLRGIMDTDWC